jgi:hypothetical protein
MAYRDLAELKFLGTISSTGIVMSNSSLISVTIDTISKESNILSSIRYHRLRNPPPGAVCLKSQILSPYLPPFRRHTAAYVIPERSSK